MDRLKDDQDLIDFMEFTADANPDLSEAEMLRLLVQTIQSDLTEVLRDLDHIVERWKYYSELPDLETIEELNMKTKRIKETIQ